MSEPLMVLPPQPTGLLNLPDADLTTLIQRLQHCSFGMNHAAKRIATQVAAVPVETLSPAQRNAVICIARRFRRQLSPGAIACVTRAKPAAAA